jgi:hypothetical protein
MLHTFSDKSILKRISAKTLVGIPVWRGNRHIDMNHVNQIKNDIGDDIQKLDKTVFHVVIYNEDNKLQKYLVDGQHRKSVIQSYFEENFCIPDFDVLVIEKKVEDESEAIEYFNTINNVKPQHDDDINNMVNKYIKALEDKFNKDKKNILIKPVDKTTKRPFLSSALLRKVLEEHGTLLKHSKEFIKNFVNKVEIWNKKKIQEYELGSIYIATKERSILESCLEKRFVLAFDSKLPWIQECL